MNIHKLSVRDLCLIGIFTAIISVLAQISIPMPTGVPLTLQTFAISLAGIVLGAKRGSISVLVYILLGSFGVPVFASFGGGFAHVFGPTGGFILSFPVISIMAGIAAEKNDKLWLMFGLVTGSAINFLCGMLMFSLITSSGLNAAFTACVLPFIPTTVIKLVLAGIMGIKIKTALHKSRVMV